MAEKLLQLPCGAGSLLTISGLAVQFDQGEVCVRPYGKGYMITAEDHDNREWLQVVVPGGGGKVHAAVARVGSPLAD